MMRAIDANDLTELIGNIVIECLQKGMKSPLVVVAVGANGSIVSARYTETAGGVDIEPLTGGGELKAPVNFMIVDAEGDATRIVLKPGDVPNWIQ
jgi:hypothetical protein